jgi:hypothetical protein
VNFWGIYEREFPGGSNMKAPRGFRDTRDRFFNPGK